MWCLLKVQTISSEQEHYERIQCKFCTICCLSLCSFRVIETTLEKDAWSHSHDSLWNLDCWFSSFGCLFSLSPPLHLRCAPVWCSENEEHGSLFVVLEDSCSLYVYPMGRHEFQLFRWAIQVSDFGFETCVATSQGCAIRKLASDSRIG